MGDTMIDIDDICMQYEEQVESGEIDPKRVSLQDYIEDVVSSAIDEAEIANGENR